MNPVQHCTKTHALFCDGTRRLMTEIPTNAVNVKFNLKIGAYEVRTEKDGPWLPITNREVRADETIVVNQHRLVGDWKNDPNFVFIGRPTMFGNPHRVRRGDKGGFAVKKYRQTFLEQIKRDPTFGMAVLALRGKCLVCFCKPNPCHGDVIKEWLDANKPSFDKRHGGVGAVEEFLRGAKLP